MLRTSVFLTSIYAGVATAHAGAVCPSPSTNLVACKTLKEIGADSLFVTNPQDQPMVAFKPTPIWPPVTPKLVVIFHGHPGPATTNFTEFQRVAADNGMYSITLDADFNGAAGETDVCAANATPTVPCTHDPSNICGCYTHCYNALHTLIWNGTTHAGLPDPVAGIANDPPPGYHNLHYLPIEYRLSSYLSWLSKQPGGSGFAQFLNADGTPKYSKIVVAGLSRGVALAGIIAKNRQTDRWLMFSGPSDQLNEDAGDTENTVYRWGLMNGVGSCEKRIGSPAWIADNDLNGNTGAHWQTRKVYSLIDARTGGWDADGPAHVNWDTLKLKKAHNPGYTDQYFNIGTWDAPNYGFYIGQYHALVSNKICETSPTGDDGHVETLSNSGCGSDPGEATYRHALWAYMLTNDP